MSRVKCIAVAAMAEDLQLVAGNAKAVPLGKSSFEILCYALVESDRSAALGTDQVVVPSRRA